MSDAEIAALRRRFRETKDPIDEYAMRVALVRSGRGREAGVRIGDLVYLVYPAPEVFPGYVVQEPEPGGLILVAWRDFDGETQEARFHVSLVQPLPPFALRWVRGERVHGPEGICGHCRSDREASEEIDRAG